MLTAYAALAIAALCWSGNMLAGRALHDTMPALALAWWRWLLILLVLAPFVARPLARAWPTIRDRWPLLLLLGMLSAGLFNALVFQALHHTTATNAALLNSSIPVWTALLGMLWGRLRPRAPELVGLAISLAGVVVIASRGQPALLARLDVNAGDAMMMAGMVSWSVYALLMPLRPKSIGPYSYLWITGALGLPAVLAAAVIAALADRDIGGAASATARLAAALGDSLAAPSDTAAWVGVAYLALFPSILATAAYNHAIDRVGPLRAGQAVHLVPVFTALIAHLLLEEAIEGFHLAGFALILAGLAMSGWRAGDARASVRSRSIVGQRSPPRPPPPRSGASR